MGNPAYEMLYINQILNHIQQIGNESEITYSPPIYNLNLIILQYNKYI